MGIFSSIFGSGGSGDLEAALAQYGNITLPELKELNLELYKQVVKLNPELETAVNLGPSAMEGITTDPMLKKAQMDALRELQGIGSGEEQLSDVVSKLQVENDVNRNLKGNQDAIMQNLATRGMSGGGNELVARQMATQSAANRQADLDLQVRADAQKRALEALMQSGQLGAQMESNDFNRQSQIAQSQDAISKFNAQNQQNVQSRNVQNKNNAQEWNATNAQNIANQNVGVNNQAQYYNKNLPQQQFENQLGLADSKSGAYSNQAAIKEQRRQGDQQLVGSGLMAGAYLFSDERVKENKQELSNEEVSDLLSKITGYKYNYKPETLEDDGEKVGVMAQDLENSELGKGMVKEDENGVKVVDSKQAAMAALAALANIDSRLKKIEDK